MVVKGNQKENRHSGGSPKIPPLRTGGPNTDERARLPRECGHSLQCFVSFGRRAAGFAHVDQSCPDAIFFVCYEKPQRMFVLCFLCSLFQSMGLRGFYRRLCLASRSMNHACFLGSLCYFSWEALNASGAASLSRSGRPEAKRAARPSVCLLALLAQSCGAVFFLRASLGQLGALSAAGGQKWSQSVSCKPKEREFGRS